MKRHPRFRRRQATNRFDFQRLESRRLLAGDLSGTHQVRAELPSGANIVANGDFETVIDGADNFYAQDEVAGWNAIDAATGQEINIFNWNVAGYDNVLDLDSTITEFDRVYQDVATMADTEYLIAFDYRNHPTIDVDATAFTHDFEVLWNDELVGRYTGGDHWNTGVITVTSSSLDATRLLFREIRQTSATGATDAGDGRGALLDNIRVFESHQEVLENGSFETTDQDQTLFFRSEQVEAWSVVAPDISDRWIQIVANGDITGTEGNQYLNLDTTNTNRDIVYTDVATTAGQSYYVLFEMRTDGSQTEKTPDELRVRWNGQWASTIMGTSQWETYGLMLLADSELTRLTFLEPGEISGDGSGPLIDNVRIFNVVGSDLSEDLNLSVDFNGDEAGTDGTAVFTPGVGAQPIAQGISLAQSGTELTSAVVTIDGVVDGANEVISISTSAIPTDSGGTAKISVLGYDSATQRLTMTGTATTQEYQTLLSTLTYFNAATEVSTTNRTVTVLISDNTLPVGDSTAHATIDMSIETDQAVIDDAILQKFIADNNLDANNVGDGLYVVMDTVGTGLNPTINNRVRVKYTGKFIELNDQNDLVEGGSFDSSSDDGVTFPLTGVIDGWKQGIPLFKTGGVGQLLIPSALAYGPVGTTDPFGVPDGRIGPNTVLVFDIELLEIFS